MRLNNRIARLLANKWLLDNGIEPIEPELSYTDFATELRRKTTKTVLLVPFCHRPDAVSYVRDFARKTLTTS